MVGVDGGSGSEMIEQAVGRWTKWRSWQWCIVDAMAIVAVVHCRWRLRCSSSSVRMPCVYCRYRVPVPAPVPLRRHDSAG